jgi:CSLREA domain-containing protein
MLRPRTISIICQVPSSGSLAPVCGFPAARLVQNAKFGQRVVTIAGIVLGVIELAALWGTPAWAANLTVNSLTDTVTAGDGNCTLREAISNAESDSDITGRDCLAGARADTIDFSVSGTITLGSALPNITPGSTITIGGGPPYK